MIRLTDNDFLLVKFDKLARTNFTSLAKLKRTIDSYQTVCNQQLGNSTAVAETSYF